eukprot:jgi/Mesvir1/17623/Mv08849-RA.1
MDAISVFQRAVRRYPNRRFVFDRYGRKVTYAEADSLSEDIALKFRDFYGIRQNSTVGFYASDRVAAWLAIIAVWKMGALPALVDPRATVEQLPHFLRPIQAQLFVTCKETAHNLRGLVKCPIVELENLEKKNWSPMDDDEDERHVQEESGLSHALHHSGSPLYCSFTSGSTGPPKGAVLLSGPVTLGTACIAERLALTSSDTVLATTPMASSFQLVSCLLPALHVGATVGLMAGASCGEIWTTAKPHRSPVLVAYPLTLGDVLASAPPQCEPGTPPAGEAPPAGNVALVGRPAPRPPFRVALSGGSPLAPRIKRDFWRLLGVRLLESYGQSELGGFMAMGSLFDAVDECGPDSTHRHQHGPGHHNTNLPPFYPRGPPASVRGVAGRPLPDRPAFVVFPWQTKEEREGGGGGGGEGVRAGGSDASNVSVAARVVAEELGLGQVGEVVVPFGYFQGYLGMPEATAAATRGGWLHTGDLAVTDADGGIKVMGRVGERQMALVRGGFLRELEDAMYEHDGVRHAVAVEDASGKGVVVYVELHTVARATVTAKELRDFVARPEAGIPAGLIPAHVRLLNAFPRTFSGKADRATLASMDWHGPGS